MLCYFSALREAPQTFINYSNKNKYRTIYSPQLDGRKFNRLMKIGSIPIFSVFGTELERFLLYNTRILSGIQRMFFLKMQNFPFIGLYRRQINKFEKWIYFYTSVDTSNKDSPISFTQNLIIFQCFKTKNNYII